MIGPASTFWDVFWVLLIFIPVTIAWIAAVVDLVVRRRDLKWWQVGLWLLAILALPIVGMLFYFVTRPVLPEEQAAFANAGHAAAADSTARYAAALKDLSDLRDRGVISDEEFATQRANLQPPPASSAPAR